MNDVPPNKWILVGVCVCVYVFGFFSMVLMVRYANKYSSYQPELMQNVYEKKSQSSNVSTMQL